MLLLMLCTSLSAQNDTIYIWPNDVPGAKMAKAAPVITTLDDGSTRVTELSNPNLEVFHPAEGTSNGKGIIVCPGGGYVRLAVHKEGQTVAAWLATLGYTAFVLQYQVPDNKDGALYDAQRAFRLVRSRADEFGLDPDQIGGIGFSAGAHVIARTALADPAITYAAQDAIDAQSWKPDCMMIIYPGYLDQGPDRSFSPDLKVSKETVPTFIFQTMDDRIVPSAFVFARALRDVGANVTLHLLPEGGHGYGMYPGNPAAEAWPGLLATWLKAHF